MLATAKERLEWATGIGAKTQFPVPYTQAVTAYMIAMDAKKVKNWNDAMTSAQATITAVAEIEKLHKTLKDQERNTAVTATPEVSPAKTPLHPVSFTGIYTVKSGDSYWSIAYQFYGDAQKWKLIYNANKTSMKNPDNPHAIFPGMVLTIPGITER
ncbi:MAG: LysM peptidoglycan-binding domain-containing protein [Treponema sp.]|nr:LysM peptidoglycan-binding domain-containing protein [Treponema sp.]